MQEELSRALEYLSKEASELYLPREIPVLDYVPSPIVFLRKYVALNRPVVFKNCLKSWPAFTKWTNDYLEQVLWDKKVTVTATPNGYADAPVRDKFVLPEERLMLFRDLLQLWKNNDNSSGVYYVQKQNSNFLDEFAALLPDADSHLEWASEAFGSMPDAVNFWMGNADSVTSMHKDHYENMYVVVRGSKTFILHPPTDIHWIPYQTYKLAEYKENMETKQFEIIDIYEEGDGNTVDRKEEQRIDEHLYQIANVDDILTQTEKDLNSKLSKHEEGTHENTKDRESMKNKKAHMHKTVSWIAIDPLCPDVNTYPQYRKCNKFEVKVEAGDILYLPSLWFHHVQQSDNTIAINFWYDMEYDIKYNYFKFVEKVSEIVSA